MTTLEWVSLCFVLAGVFSAVGIAFDLRGRRQPMRIMEPVWVLTGLWAGLPALWAYYVFGRASRNGSEPMRMHEMKGAEGMRNMPGMEGMHSADGHKAASQASVRPDWRSVTLSTLHCGAGCSLADVVGEWLLVLVPVSIGGSLLAGSWTVDYLLALIFGIGFQYAAIRSMERISRGEAIVRAAKADVLSLTAWQAGMYGWMAVAIFGVFDGAMPERTSWTFWFMMQVAMYFGFLCSYPVNVALIRRGIKHAM